MGVYEIILLKYPEWTSDDLLNHLWDLSKYWEMQYRNIVGQRERLTERIAELEAENERLKRMLENELGENPYYCTSHHRIHDGTCPECEAEKADAYIDEMKGGV